MQDNRRKSEKLGLFENSEIVATYGSTSSLIKMEGQNGVINDSDSREKTNKLGSNFSSTTSDFTNYRRITDSVAFIPPTRRKWYQYLKSFLQLKFRRSSPHSNVVHTTKYTLITFLPKNLFEQFHRFANLYFLIIIILSFVPAIETVGKEVVWIPLTFVLLVTLVKDGFEDFRRYRSDKEINNRLCTVYNRDEDRFVQKRWQDVRVGDFVQLSCDEIIPADLLLLQSTDEDGLCYIQTSNLDGETNLKQREVPIGVLQPNQDGFVNRNNIEDTVPFHPSQFRSELHYEQPNNRIYDFNGFICQPDGSRIAVGRSHLILRGCILRNTDYVVGVVVYAGHETKSMLSNSGPRAKRSKLERDINLEITSQVLILFSLCFIGAVLNGIWVRDHLDKNIVFFPFTTSTLNPALDGFIRFWTFVILYQVIIPISMYVSMEVVKIGQTIFINWDLDMYYPPTDRPFQCRALNINEDLGQIEYALLDKTGTLTENEMVFRCCTVAGKMYPHGLEANLENVHPDPKLIACTEQTDYPHPQKKELEKDPQLLRDLSNPQIHDTPLHDFFITMAICNTVVVAHRTESKADGSENEDIEIVYEAESSDEYALVQAAKSYGYVLLSRSPTLIRLQTPNQEILEFELLRVLGFSSERKRMSVIVKEKDKITLYCKGADSVIYNRLRTDLESQTNTLFCRTETQEHMDQYARLGLRMLCLTKRELSEQTYQDWNKLQHQAELDLDNRENLLVDLASKIETELELLGATGIEDRLQEGVPDAIQSLRDAGIKIWVVTGDKKETAINVGYASCLLEQDMEIIPLQASSEEECRQILLARCQDLNQQTPYIEDSQTSIISNAFNIFKTPFIKLQNFSTTTYSNGCTSHLTEQNSKALVVDGQTLAFALKKPCSKLFLTLAKECSTVLCCRAAPLQKAAVVQLVKESKAMTLAVGDGANDVSMIQQANVGIGIAGKEGMQAVLASDFNMARFRYIKKLLLVHGHWCYSRLANMLLYFFFKNVMYATLLLWLQFFNGFSGSYAIDGINLIIFNLVYTSLPIFVVAIGDQDLRAETLLENGAYYEQGRCSREYTRLKFWVTMLEAFYQSAVIFFVAFGTFYGSTIGLVEFGFVINIAAVIVTNLYLTVETLHWTWIHHFVMWASCIVLFIFNYVYCAINTQQRIIDTYYVMQVISGDGRFWFVLLITPVIALFPRLLCKTIRQDLFPTRVLLGRAHKKTKLSSSSVPTRTTVPLHDYLPHNPSTSNI